MNKNCLAGLTEKIWKKFVKNLVISSESSNFAADFATWKKERDKSNDLWVIEATNKDVVQELFGRDTEKGITRDGDM